MKLTLWPHMDVILVVAEFCGCDVYDSLQQAAIFYTLQVGVTWN